MRLPRLLGSSLGVVLSLLAGCAAPADEAETEATDGASAIVGGIATDAAPAVGFLTAVRSASAEPLTFCTATLIAPNVILTAAHCLESDELLKKKNQSTSHLHFGVGLPKNRRLVRVTSFKLHEEWAGSANMRTSGPNDVAYGILASPIHNVTPLGIRRRRHLGGCSYTSLGYGISQAGYRVGVDKVTQAPADRRRSLEVCASWLRVDGTIETGSDKGSVCQGDSGGPLLHRTDTGLEVVGVTSYLAWKSKDSGCDAGARGYYTPISEHTEFVDEAIAVGEEALRAPPVPEPKPTPSPAPSTPEPAPAPAPSTPEPAPAPSTPTPAPAPAPSTPESAPAPAPSDEAAAAPSSEAEPAVPPTPSRTVEEFENEDPVTAGRRASASSSPTAAGCAVASGPTSGSGRDLAALAPLAAVVGLIARRRRAARRGAVS